MDDSAFNHITEWMSDPTLREPILSHTHDQLVIAIVDQVFTALEQAIDRAVIHSIDPEDGREVYLYAHRAWVDSGLMYGPLENLLLSRPPIMTPTKRAGDHWLTIHALERFFVGLILNAICNGRARTEGDREAVTHALVDPHTLMKQVYFEDLGLEV